MLSPGEIEKIRAAMERLEKAGEECADSGIRKLIEACMIGNRFQNAP
jgi:hypothetical protein